MLNLNTYIFILCNRLLFWVLKLGDEGKRRLLFLYRQAIVMIFGKRSVIHWLLEGECLPIKHYPFLRNDR